MVSAVEKDRARLLVSASEYSIADILKKVKPLDKNFLKYVPDNFLSDSQRMAKQEAIREEERKLESFMKTKETGVISDTMLENQASTRLLPVSDISIPQLIQKINPKGKKIKVVLKEDENEKRKMGDRSSWRWNSSAYEREQFGKRSDDNRGAKDSDAQGGLHGEGNRERAFHDDSEGRRISDRFYQGLKVRKCVDNNCRYLEVEMTKIETGVISDTALQKGERTRLLPVSNISVPQLIQKIKYQNKFCKKQKEFHVIRGDKPK